MKKSISFLICLLLVVSCKREKAHWDMDIIGPLATAEISLMDILPDSLVTTNNEGYLSLVLDKNLINLTADTLLSIKDTTIENGYTLPPPLFAIEVEPGVPFPVSPSSLTLNPGNDIEIKEAWIDHGEISLSMSNPMETSIIVTYLLPDLTLNGVTFEFMDTLAPAQNNIPSVLERSFALDDYHLNLSGTDGSIYNTINQSFSAINNPDGQTVTLTALDTLGFAFTIQELNFSYARGYFGSFDIQEESSFQFDNALNLSPGNLNLAAAQIDLEIRNGLGVDFRILESIYNSVNIASNNSLIINNDALNGNINIDRAIDSELGPIYSTRNIHLDEVNSNITDIISLAPDSFNVFFDLAVNPLSNISSSNDFIYKDDGIIIDASLDIPLHLAINDLSLEDTLNFTFEENIETAFESGELILYIDNGLPLNIAIDLRIGTNMNDSYVLVNGLEIAACESIDNDCIVTVSELHIPMTKENLSDLRNGGILIVSGVFNSNGQVKLRPDQKIKIQAVLDGIINMEI